MFSAMQGTIAVAIVLSVLVVIVAALAEGRGRYLLRVILGASPRKGMAHVYDRIERSETDWSLLGGIDSEPDPVSGRTRALEWLRMSVARGREVASAWSIAAWRGARTAGSAGVATLTAKTRELTAAAHARQLGAGSADAPVLEAATARREDARTEAAQRPAMPRRRDLRAWEPLESPRTGELAIVGRRS